MGFPGGSVVKNLPDTAGDAGLIPGSGRSPEEENGDPLQYSCLRNPMDRGSQWVTAHGIQRVRNDLATKQRQSKIYTLYLPAYKLQGSYFFFHCIHSINLRA